MVDIILACVCRGGRVPVSPAGAGGLLIIGGLGHGLVPGNEDVLRLELPVALLHGPDRDDDPAAYPQDPGQLPDGSHSPLRGGNVVDDGDGKNSIKRFILVRQRQTITDKYLLMKDIRGSSRKKKTIFVVIGQISLNSYPP